MASANTPTDIAEVFKASTLAAAEKVVDVLLLPENIEATIHDRTDLMFPAAGQPGGFFISVPAPDAARARELLEDAYKDGFVDGTDGWIIPPTP